MNIQMHIVTLISCPNSDVLVILDKDVMFNVQDSGIFAMMLDFKYSPRLHLKSPIF